MKKLTEEKKDFIKYATKFNNIIEFKKRNDVNVSKEDMQLLATYFVMTERDEYLKKLWDEENKIKRFPLSEERIKEECKRRLKECEKLINNGIDSDDADDIVDNVLDIGSLLSDLAGEVDDLPEYDPYNLNSEEFTYIDDEHMIKCVKKWISMVEDLLLNYDYSPDDRLKCNYLSTLTLIITPMFKLK